MPPTPLTPRQFEVLGFVREQIMLRGYAPTNQEICNAFGWNSVNSARDSLIALERKGYVTRQEKKSRALTLTPMAQRLFQVDPDGTVDVGQICFPCGAQYWGKSCPMCAADRRASHVG